MYFKNMLNRAKLMNMGSFLMSGCEYTEVPKDESYTEQIREADRQIYEFLEERFPNGKEGEEIRDVFFSLFDVYQRVYFELGLLVGGKIALQVHKKLEELE